MVSFLLAICVYSWTHLAAFLDGQLKTNHILYVFTMKSGNFISLLLLRLPSEDGKEPSVEKEERDLRTNQLHFSKVEKGSHNDMEGFS